MERERSEETPGLEAEWTTRRDRKAEGVGRCTLAAAVEDGS